MKRAFLLFLTTLLTSACAVATSQPATLPGSTPLPTKWSLVWSDEFDGVQGTRPNPKFWNFDLGNAEADGWGNRELQSYTADSANTSLDGEGHLNIQARRSRAKLPCWNGRTCPYTSARLTTLGRVEFMYGKVEARIKVPQGRGLLPAFWSLGKSEWPTGGEMDVMETVAETPKTVYGTLHGPNYSDEQGIEGSKTLNGLLADDYHTYTLIKRPNEIIWLVDGKPYHRVTPQSLPKNTHWVFEQPYYLLLNIAVGGNWPGTPPKSTVFPQTMKVDYVRLWRETQ